MAQAKYWKRDEVSPPPGPALGPPTPLTSPENPPQQDRGVGRQCPDWDREQLDGTQERAQGFLPLRRQGVRGHPRQQEGPQRPVRARALRLPEDPAEGAPQGGAGAGEAPEVPRAGERQAHDPEQVDQEPQVADAPQVANPHCSARRPAGRPLPAQRHHRQAH